MQHVITNSNISTIISPVVYRSVSATQPGVFTKFMRWCNAQERNRFLWLAMSILGQIGFVVPCTLIAIVFLSGNNFALWVTVCALNVPVLALNLAAQPTKVTVPVLLSVWAVNAAIILYCVAFYFL